MICLLFSTFVGLPRFARLTLHFLVGLSLLCLFILWFSLLIAKFICISCLFLNAVRCCELVHYDIRLERLLISFEVIIHARFIYLMFKKFLDLAFLFLVLYLHLIVFERLISFLIEWLFLRAVLFLAKFIILVLQMYFFSLV